jgi:signal transduction histidine kinase
MRLSKICNSNRDIESGKELREILNLLDHTINVTRTLTFELSPPILHELGLESALEWLTEKFYEQNNIQTNFIDDGNPKPLDDDIRIILFRTVRELLFNVAKHAKAKNVTVSTERKDNSIRIYISDDGIGFEVSRVNVYKGKKSGFGLFSIQERLDFLGGKLNIESKPGQGTRVNLVAPLRKKKFK